MMFNLKTLTTLPVPSTVSRSKRATMNLTAVVTVVELVGVPMPDWTQGLDTRLVTQKESRVFSIHA